MTTPVRDDEFWPDEGVDLPAAWALMPDDIRLQVRALASALPDVAFTSDFYDSLSTFGPLYVNLAHLTRWDTYHPVLPREAPTRAAYHALVTTFPNLFTTVHHTDHPGTVSLKLRLHRLSPPVAEAILAHRHATLTALGIDPTNPFLLGMP